MSGTREGSASLDSATVFTEYRERIYRYIHRIVRDPTEAEDLTQETFLRAHRELSSLRDERALAAWLYRIATHVCYDRFRQASYRHPPRSLDYRTSDSAEEPGARLSDPNAPKLDEVVEQREMSACVQEYIVQLPDDYRMAIILHDLHGLSNPEIARMLGCTLETVKVRVHRARRKLEAALQDACDFSYDDRGVFTCQRKPAED